MIKLYEKPSVYFGEEEYKRLCRVLDIVPGGDTKYSVFANKETVLNEKNNVIYICAYIIQEMVKHRPIDEWTKENIIQDIILDVIKKIDKYDAKTPFWTYILNSIKWSEIKAFNYETSYFRADDDARRKSKKCIEKINEENLSIEEAAKLMNMHQSTVYKYMNMHSELCSLESGADNMIAAPSAVETDNDYEEKQEIIDRVKSGMTKLERFIIDAYLGQADKKDWKKRTIEICKRRSITASKTSETIKKFKNTVKDYSKRAV